MLIENGVLLSVLNPDNQPYIYNDGVATSLYFQLTNQTGNVIDFAAGTASAQMDIYLPTFFTEQDLAAMTITLADWSFSYCAQQQKLTLVYMGSQSSSTWVAGSVFEFVLSNVKTTATPDSGTVQVNFLNFSAEVPSQVVQTFSVIRKPIPGNANLTDVVYTTLDNQGLVYVSGTNDPIQNELYLNIKNFTDKPLYEGSGMWTGSPKVTVVFVYGSSTGCLAPDTNTSTGSAWSIISEVAFGAAPNVWNTINPAIGGTDPHPKWVLQPAAINQEILGTGANANVTFRFKNILSFTPVGNTQVTIHFSGFMKDENTAYNDAIFVLNISKQQAPPTRGIINFFSPTPIFDVYDDKTPITIPLRWSMLDTPKASIITSYPGISPIALNYPNPPIVGYDNASVVINGTTQSVAVSMTIQAFDGNDGFLNSMQFTTFIQANMFVDPRDGKVYPVAQIGQQIWMTANLDFVAPTGSMVFGNEAKYGRLYTFAAAEAPVTPAGWRLPTETDWQRLLASNAYVDLIAGGSSGWNAQFSGYCSPPSPASGLDTYGYYWSGTGGAQLEDYVSLSTNSKTATYVGGTLGLPLSCLLAVRYVRDVS